MSVFDCTVNSNCSASWICQSVILCAVLHGLNMRMQHHMSCRCRPNHHHLSHAAPHPAQQDAQQEQPFTKVPKLSHPAEIETGAATAPHAAAPQDAPPHADQPMTNAPQPAAHGSPPQEQLPLAGSGQQLQPSIATEGTMTSMPMAAAEAPPRHGLALSMAADLFIPSHPAAGAHYQYLLLRVLAGMCAPLDLPACATSTLEQKETCSSGSKPHMCLLRTVDSSLRRGKPLNAGQGIGTAS